jgi:hypothetical protein
MASSAKNNGVNVVKDHGDEIQIEPINIDAASLKRAVEEKSRVERLQSQNSEKGDERNKKTGNSKVSSMHTRFNKLFFCFRIVARAAATETRLPSSTVVKVLPTTEQPMVDQNIRQKIVVLPTIDPRIVSNRLTKSRLVSTTTKADRHRLRNLRMAEVLYPATKRNAIVPPLLPMANSETSPTL